MRDRCKYNFNGDKIYAGDLPSKEITELLFTGIQVDDNHGEEDGTPELGMLRLEIELIMRIWGEKFDGPRG